MKIEVEYVQHMILFEAADIANREWAQQGLGHTWVSGEIFRADPVQSTKGGLCLSLNEMVVMGLSTEELERAHEIGREAIKAAIIKNQDKFVGLIVGEAREGRDYFARFPNEHGQFKLF